MRDIMKTLDKKNKNLKFKKLAKKQKLQERGITLIALVVTIIILLILSGVTLNIALSDNGLFSKAKGAVSKYKIAAAEESVEMEVLGSYNEKGIINFDTLNDNLINNLGDVYFRGKKLSSANKIEELPVVVTYNGVEVKIGDGSGKFSNIITANNYGDKVKYSAHDIEDWKIFYNNDGNVFLISSDIIPNATISNEKITKAGTYRGYLSTNDIRMDIGASSVSEDIAKKFLWNYRLIYPSSLKANTRAISQMFFDESWSTFVDDDYAEDAIGAPTLEMWIESWNEKYPNDLLYYKIEDELGYKISYDNKNFNDTIQGWEYNTENDGISLYFPRNEYLKDEEGTCRGYFIAGNMRNTGDFENGVGGVDFTGYIHCPNFFGNDNAFRPVVCLKSTVSASIGDDGVWILREES